MNRANHGVACGIRNTVFGLLSVILPVSAAAGDDSPYGPLILEEVAAGLDRPVYVTAPPGDHDRLFIVEQDGDILILDRTTGELNATPFLSISPNTAANERGLLGLAFHPDYEENGYFYVNFTGSGGATFVQRYEVSSDPDLADPGSAFDLMTVAQPSGNHNGGWIGFGPDDYLYIALGDGGGSNDPGDHGQRTETLLGAMLRIDIDSNGFPDDSTRNYAIPEENPFADSDDGPEDPRPEIWAYGLRNPWRPSFDRKTGDLWIADVGQSAREEINFQPTDSEGGENYGWRLREGMIATPSGGVGGPRPEGNVDPIYDYEFNGRRSITGGYVYRGAAMPHLQGAYFFADYMAAFINSLRYDGEAVTDITDWTQAFNNSIDGSVQNPSSFGEDADGELYLVTLSGEVYRITQPPWYLWRNREFTGEQLDNPDLSGPAATPANDGIPNLLKYALGLPADEPGHPLPVETAIREFDGQQHLAMTVHKSPDASDVTFLVEASSDLGATDPWSAAETTVVEETADRLVVRVNAPADETGRAFLRLRVLHGD